MTAFQRVSIPEDPKPTLEPFPPTFPNFTQEPGTWNSDDELPAPSLQTGVPHGCRLEACLQSCAAILDCNFCSAASVCLTWSLAVDFATSWLLVRERTCRRARPVYSRLDRRIGSCHRMLLVSCTGRRRPRTRPGLQFVRNFVFLLCGSVPDRSQAPGTKRKVVSVGGAVRLDTHTT